MWPWEHLAVAYVCYSLFARIVYRRPPTHGEAVAVAVGSQLPDLIDKPLGWQLGVLPSGSSLGHSALLAAPGSLVALVVAAVRERSGVGVAFAVGWLSHLATDVVYPVATGGSPNPSLVLWPLVPPVGTPEAGLLDNFWYFLDRYLEHLLSPEGVVYLGLEAGLLVGAVVLWIVDGRPGLPSMGSNARSTSEEAKP